MPTVNDAVTGASATVESGRLFTDSYAALQRAIRAGLAFAFSGSVTPTGNDFYLCLENLSSSGHKLHICRVLSRITTAIDTVQIDTALNNRPILTTAGATALTIRNLSTDAQQSAPLCAAFSDPAIAFTDDNIIGIQRVGGILTDHEWLRDGEEIVLTPGFSARWRAGTGTNAVYTMVWFYFEPL